MPTLIAGLLDLHVWYALPLLLSVSLVYAATRHELMGHIVRHALRFGGWIVGFMGLIFLVLYFISRNL